MLRPVLGECFTTSIKGFVIFSSSKKKIKKYLAAKVVLCIWWEHIVVIYYKLYQTQLMRFSRALHKKRPQYEQRHKKVILQHDNARPHVAKPVKTYLETLKWEVLPDPPYSPDIAPSGHYLFRSMAHGLADQQFRSYEDIEKSLDSWIASEDENFYRNGIRVLPERWLKVVANDGKYFEWFIFNHVFTLKFHFHQKYSVNLVAHLILFSLFYLFVELSLFEHYSTIASCKFYSQ